MIRKHILHIVWREYSVGGVGGLCLRIARILQSRILVLFFWKLWYFESKCCAKKSSRTTTRIVYVVPGLALSGGIAIVIQHVKRLIERGYAAEIISISSNDVDISWIPENVPIKLVSDFNQEQSCCSDVILVATQWSTVWWVARTKSWRKWYFVQSDERRFYDNPATIEMVERTYNARFEYITEAKWIQKWLKKEFGHDAGYVPNGLDEKIFHKTKPLQKKGTKKRVLLEGPISIPFKGMEDAYNAVKDLDCEIWIVSSSGKPKKDWRYDMFFESVPMNKMKEIYSSCDIFLKMSRTEGFFGPPMEAMACGCSVVVGKCTGYDEYIEHGKNALVVDQGDIDGAKKAIQELIDNDIMRNNLIENGHNTVRDWNWEYSIDLLERLIL